jgi:predicted secreted protein
VAGENPVHQDTRPAGGDEPEAAAGELERRCSICHAAIPAEFFVLRGLLVCPTCAEGIQQRQAGRDKVRRALLFGAVTAAVSALVWYLLTAATSRQLAAFAVVAGLAVGLAVHQGSGGRGGLRYQVTAALLVYAAFVLRYVPPVFGGIADAIKQEHATRMQAENQPGAGAQVPAPPAPTATTPATAAPEPGAAASRPSTLATLKAYFVFTAVAWGLVLASPFMPGTTGALTLLSLAAGMALAFRLNHRVPIRGPFLGMS